MKKKSFEIALSAVAAATATIFLVLGSYVPTLAASGWILGCFAIMLPLSKKFYLGGLLAYVAASLLALFIGSGNLSQFWKLFPFIAFFGIHPLVNALQFKLNINKYAALVFKTMWFDVCVYAFYLLFMSATGGNLSSYAILGYIQNNIIKFILIGCSLFFIFYDFAIINCQKVMDRLIARIRK
jgi:hypothetical protein